MPVFLPFALPDISEDEVSEVVDSLRSGWLTTGPKTKQFENDFAAYLGDGVETISVNSATSGLHLALDAIGIKPDDEIITSPFTFAATAEIIRYFDAHPVFVDIDPQTLNIDPNKIESAITSKTKAIIPVHFAGLACDMVHIHKIAQKHHLMIIEDAAHAFQSTYHDSLIGQLNSDITVFSFYATKTITTGEGGMIVTKNPKIAERCKIMRFHGISKDIFDRYVSKKPSWFYEIVAPGYKYNMPDIAAAIGIHQLKRANKMLNKRQSMASKYDQGLKDLPLILPPHPPKEDVHSWHLYVIQLTNEAKINRDRFVEMMMEKGIGCGVHYIPLHIHPYWRDKYQLKPNDFPHSLDAYQRIVSLPIYTKMSEEDQTRVIETIKSIWNI
ncbi:MAG: DegT/DnrJ/EryC1/StrS family aminotransferase [Gammaproteobacteria bacterium]|nr:DegT/DnrJ/EryC1/StrS family aminotransferase [Gammaproteobacteria bacterium]